MKTIGVIVPVFNRASLVTGCLDSILQQSVRPSELIVVDNGSTDSTYETVSAWMQTHERSDIEFKLISQPERGACKARQTGLEHSGSNYLIFFDSDDVMLPCLIENAAQSVEVNPEIDIVCWKAKINKLDGSVKIPPFNPEKPLENHLVHALLRPQGYMVRKEFLEKAGGWKKPIKVWNDFELGLRLLLRNPKLAALPKVMSTIYSQEDSITGKDFSSKEGQWEATLEEMDKTVDETTHPEKNRIKRILNYRRAILAAHYFREGNKSGAKKLMMTTIENKGIRERILLKFSYYYTRMGLRGAWRLTGWAF